MATTIQENKPSRQKRLAKRAKKNGEEHNRKSVTEKLSIDFPVENEQILPGSYTIRISAPAHSKVEVAVDEAEWQPTRDSVGYWWHDWWPSQPGQHKIAARAQTGKGRWKKSDERRCVVIGPSVQ